MTFLLAYIQMEAPASSADAQRAASLVAKYPQLHVLRPTHQLRGLHTIVRNKDTSREDFIFYSDRLIRLLIEEGVFV